MTSLEIIKIADDAIRTRDIGLGRTTLYQLSYIRRFVFDLIINIFKKKSSKNFHSFFKSVQIKGFEIFNIYFNIENLEA